MIPIYQPYLTERESEYVNQALQSGWISSRGEFIEKFESRCADLLNVHEAITVSNGTVSLMLILAALKLSKDTYIFIPSLTYVASASPAYWLGYKIVFFDSDLNYQPSCNSLQEVYDQVKTFHELMHKTSFKAALILPQLYGNSPDMESFIEFCKTNTITMIEDSAEVFGSTYNDKMLGTFGRAGSFSFFGNKTITTGEGGLVVTNDISLADSMRSLKSHAHDKSFHHFEPAFNFRMTNIQAAIGLAQLDNYAEIVDKKVHIANTYRSYLPPPYRSVETNSKVISTEWMPLFMLPEDMEYVWFQEQMLANGIDTRPCFMPMHLMSGFSGQQFITLPGSCSTSESIYSKGFNLPCYPSLTDDQITQVLSALQKVAITHG